MYAHALNIFPRINFPLIDHPFPLNNDNKCWAIGLLSTLATLTEIWTVLDMQLLQCSCRKEVLTEWMRLSELSCLKNSDVGYVRNLGPLISYLCFTTFTENWTRPDLQFLQ